MASHWWAIGIIRYLTNLESVQTYEETEKIHTLVIGEQLTSPGAVTLGS